MEQAVAFRHRLIAVERGEGRPPARHQLRVGLGHVIGLHEGLLRHLPVGIDPGLIVIVEPHLAQLDAIDQRCDRRHQIVEGGRVFGQIDIDEAGPHPRVHRFQVDIAAAGAGRLEFLLAGDECVLAGQVPFPAVERADDGFQLEPARAHGKLGGAVRADIVECPDGDLIHPHHHDGMVEDFVDGVIPGVADLVQPAGHLPHARPEQFRLQLREAPVGIARGGQAVALHRPFVGQAGRGTAAFLVQRGCDSHPTLHLLRALPAVLSRQAPNHYEGRLSTAKTQAQLNSAAMVARWGSEHKSAHLPPLARPSFAHQCSASLAMS